MTAYLKAHYPVEFMAALLSGDIHGPQLQEEGLARRASGRLPADGHRGRAAGRESLGRRFHRRATARFTSACRRSKAAAARRAKRSSRPATAADRSAICSISASGSIRRCEPGDDRNADQGRRVRFASAQAVAARRGDRPGRAIGRSRSPPIARAAKRSLFGGDDDDAGCQARRRRCPDMAEWADRERAAEGKRSARLLSHQPSAGRAQADARPSTARTRPPTSPQLKEREEVILGGMISSIKFSHTQNPQPGKPSKYAMFDLEDIDGSDSLHPLARWLRRNGASGRRRQRCSLLRGVDRPPRRRRSQLDRQRADPARPARLALHDRHRDPHR